MKQFNLISLSNLEKLNASELNDIKGGTTIGVMSTNVSEDSEHHDCNNNDTFEKEDQL